MLSLKKDSESERDIVKILITDGDYKHTLGMVRSLSKEGYTVDCIGSQKSVCRLSRHLNAIAFPQNKFNDLYFADFITFLEKSDYKILIPVGGSSVDLISRHRNELPKHVCVVMSDKQAISACLDKKKTIELAQQQKIPYPRSWVFSDIKEFSSYTGQYLYPLVVKGSNELEKINPIYVENKRQLELAIQKYKSNKFPIIQEYVYGDGVGFFALYDRGVLRRYFMHKRIRENPPTGGASCCAISFYDDRLYKYGKALLDSLNWHGVAMVEFKRDASTGELMLMEINPKFWGSHDLAIECGNNFAKGLVDLCMGKLSNENNNYIVNLKYQWPLDGDFEHMLLRTASIKNVFFDLLNPRVKSNLWLSDPIPWLHQLAKLLARPYFRIRSFFSKHLVRCSRIGLKGTVIRGFTEFTGIPILRYSEVTKNIYVGMQPGKLGIIYLKLSGFYTLLNLRSEHDDLAHNIALPNYLWIPVDEFDSPTVVQLNKGVEFLHSAITNTSKVYVHCREGVSRAPLFVAAYLISVEGVSVDDSIAIIKKKRFFINILENQRAALSQYELYCNNKAL